MENENQNSSTESSESPRPALVWSWQFDPLNGGEVEITFGGKGVAVAPTLNNAALICDRLNRHDKLLEVAQTLARLALDIPEPPCADCQEAAKHAFSDSTTAGFFYSKCEKHLVPANKRDSVG